MLIYRYSVKDLLDHEFFAENVKFEILDADENEGGGGGSEDPILNMRMELPTKELTAPKTNKGQESIEFVYDLHKDDPAEVVNEMVSSCDRYYCIAIVMSAQIRVVQINWLEIFQRMFIR